MSIVEYGGMPRLDALLARAAVSQPRRDAVVFQAQTWSYAEVHDRACRLAGALAALGVEKGDRVAYWASNRAEFVEVLFGVTMLGATSRVTMPAESTVGRMSRRTPNCWKKKLVDEDT